jgi:hypothetical protein
MNRRTINCSMSMDARRCPRLRMMLTTAVGERQEAGLPAAERGVLLVEKICSKRDSFATASDLPRSLNSSISRSKLCQSRQGLLAVFFLCLYQVFKNVDSRSCLICPSQSVGSNAHVCPTVKANFPQRCRVLRPTLVFLTNCLLYPCSSIDFLTRPRF